MTDADVLVLGRGLGGYAAALAATSAAAGVDVHLVCGPERPLDRHTGLIDVLGHGPEAAGPVVDPFDAVPSLPADHPYRVLGTDAIRAGLSLFDEATGGEYLGETATENALVPSMRGHPTPAARYPAASAHGLLSDEGDALLVAFQQLPDFHGLLAAERLASADVPFEVDGVRTQAPVTVGDEEPALAIARALDENDAVGPRNQPAREGLARALTTIATDEDRFGFPAVLGVAETSAIHATLSAELDVRVFEIPVGPPSVPGRRLEALLRDAVREAGVTVHRDRTVADVRAGPESIDAVELADEADGPDQLTPGAVVLATGGPAAGGIAADRDGVREPLCSCHVPHPSDRGAWTSADPLGDHALARLGVRIDDAARPLSADHAPEYDNLYAAGSVVGGHDPDAEGSRSGVALASGYVAGTRAAER